MIILKSWKTMIKISFRDILADLPPSVLKKKIKEIEQRNNWILISDYGENIWREEFVKMKNLKNNTVSVRFNKFAFIDSVDEEIIFEHEPGWKGTAPDFIYYYFPAMDIGFTCRIQGFDSLIKNKDKFKIVLNYITKEFEKNSTPSNVPVKKVLGND